MRLTARTENGCAYLVNVKPDEQEVDSPYKNTLQCILDCFERLAAYEDTGLSPDDCLEYKKFEDELIASGKSFSHVVELLQAEAEGRLVVLPCKVGDTVYKLWYKPCHLGEDHPDGMNCDGCYDECDIKRAVIPFTANSVRHIVDMLDSLNSFWYLTRAEAEAALAAEKEERNEAD